MCSSLLKILTSEIWQSAPNDTKLNSNVLARKYPTYGVPRTVSPKFSYIFSLQLAVLKILHILGFSNCLPY